MARRIIHIDRIRNKYGFTAIPTGRILRLKGVLPAVKEGYRMHTGAVTVGS